MNPIKTRFAAANYKRLLPFLEAVEHTPEKHFRFVNDPYMPLSIENLSHTFNDCPVYGMMHFYTQNGDLMRDPDMTFYVDRENGRIIPMTYQQDNAGVYQEVFDGPGAYRPGLLHELDQFLNLWTKNILAQGYDSTQADNARPGYMTPEDFAASIES